MEPLQEAIKEEAKFSPRFRAADERVGSINLSTDKEEARQPRRASLPSLACVGDEAESSLSPVSLHSIRDPAEGLQPPGPINRRPPVFVVLVIGHIVTPAVVTSDRSSALQIHMPGRRYFFRGSWAVEVEGDLRRVVSKLEMGRPHRLATFIFTRTSFRRAGLRNLRAAVINARKPAVIGTRLGSV